MFKREIGEIIPGLKINGKKASYPVVNEKAIRINAFIVFFLGFLTLLYTYFSKNFFYFKILVLVLFFDFLLKNFFGPKKSFFSLLANFIVKNRKKQYVGAIQKGFAWFLGGLMLFLVNIFLFFNLKISFYLFSIFIFLVFFEAFFGFCIGCYIYIFLRQKGYIKQEKNSPVCANGVCELKK